MERKQLLQQCLITSLTLLSLCVFNDAAANTVGKVIFATGTVTAGTRPLSRGAVINTGEHIKTGAGSTAQLRFTDGTLVSVLENSEYVVNDYSVPAEKKVSTLLKGGLRSLTGPESIKNYTMNTQVATIGIRGTFLSAAVHYHQCPTNHALRSECETAHADFGCSQGVCQVAQHNANNQGNFLIGDGQPFKYATLTQVQGQAAGAPQLSNTRPASLSQPISGGGGNGANGTNGGKGGGGGGDGGGDSSGGGGSSAAANAMGGSFGGAMCVNNFQVGDARSLFQAISDSTNPVIPGNQAESLGGLVVLADYSMAGPFPPMPTAIGDVITSTTVGTNPDLLGYQGTLIGGSGQLGSIFWGQWSQATCAAGAECDNIGEGNIGPGYNTTWITGNVLTPNALANLQAAPVTYISGTVVGGATNGGPGGVTAVNAPTGISQFTIDFNAGTVSGGFVVHDAFNGLDWFTHSLSGTIQTTYGVPGSPVGGITFDQTTVNGTASPGLNQNWGTTTGTSMSGIVAGPNGDLGILFHFQADWTPGVFVGGAFIFQKP